MRPDPQHDHTGPGQRPAHPHLPRESIFTSSGMPLTAGEVAEYRRLTTPYMRFLRAVGEGLTILALIVVAFVLYGGFMSQ